MGSKSGIDAVLDVALTNNTGLSPTIAAFHNADNQNLGAVAYGLNTGGVAQGINAANNLDRQRESGSDLIPSRGVFAASTQTAQEFLATCTTSVAVGAGAGSTASVPVTVTLSIANTNGFVVGGTLNFEPVFSGTLPTRYEAAVITAVVANTSVTVQFQTLGALFTHTQPYVVQTFLANQQRDFSGEGPCLTGIGANIAVDIESNSGGPPLTSGLASGWTLDTDRNLQGKNNAQMAITSTTAANTFIQFTNNPWTSGLIIGQQIILSIGANGAAVEEVIVSKNNTPVTGAGPITVNIVNPVVNSSSTFATFDNFGVGMPSTATVLGTEDCTVWVYDPNATDPKRPLTAAKGSQGVLFSGPTTPGTPIGASSGNVANASAVATLAAAAGKTTYISGFQVTASGATAGLPVIVTVAGLLGGTQSFIFTFPAGVLVGAAPLLVAFPAPIPASAQNTAIVVTCPAGGSGATNAAVSAQGYQA